MHHWSNPAISLLIDPLSCSNQLTLLACRCPSSLHSNQLVNRLANLLSSPHLVLRANHPCVRRCPQANLVADPAALISLLRNRQRVNRPCLSVLPSSQQSRNQNARLLTQATDPPFHQSVFPLQRRRSPHSSHPCALHLNHHPNHPVDPMCHTQRSPRNAHPSSLHRSHRHNPHVGRLPNHLHVQLIIPHTNPLQSHRDTCCNRLVNPRANPLLCHPDNQHPDQRGHLPLLTRLQRDLRVNQVAALPCNLLSSRHPIPVANRLIVLPNQRASPPIDRVVNRALCHPNVHLVNPRAFLLPNRLISPRVSPVIQLTSLPLLHRCTLLYHLLRRLR